MVIYKEKKSFVEGNNPAVIKSSYSNGHFKATIDIDCAKALAGIDPYFIKRYNLQKVTPEHVYKVFYNMLSVMEFTAVDDDSELSQRLADLF